MLIVGFFIVLIAIILGKWIGSVRQSSGSSTNRMILGLLLLVGAFLLPVLYMAYLEHGFWAEPSGRDFVWSFFTSSLLYWFRIYSNENATSGGSIGWQTPDTKPTKFDDLTLIEGIGPKIQEVLYKEGITTFKTLAGIDPSVIKSLLESAGNNFRQHDPTTRPMQSKIAEQGKWEQLQKRQDELKGGKI